MIVSDEVQQFWDETLRELGQIPLEDAVEPVELDGLMESRHRDLVNNFRVVMTSLGGIRIRGWYSYPDGKPGKGGWPAVVVFPGYTGIVPLPVHLVRLGYATLTLYPRGQGESAHEWQIDRATWATWHLEDREFYYYRGAYMDCVRAIDFMTRRPEIDSSRIAVWGQSQGGGLTLATATLDNRVAVAVSETPWPCDIRLLLDLTSAPPNQEIPDYLASHPDVRDDIISTLDLFDVARLAPMITCPTLLSAGAVDEVHPYKSVVSAFERIPSLKSLIVYPDLDHGHRNDFARHALVWIDRYLS